MFGNPVKTLFFLGGNFYFNQRAHERVVRLFVVDNRRIFYEQAALFHALNTRFHFRFVHGKHCRDFLGRYTRVFGKYV